MPLSEKACYLITFLFTTSSLVFAEEALDFSSCRSNFEYGYEKLPDDEKQLRHSAFGTCVHKKSRLKLRNNYNETIQKVEKWRLNANKSLTAQLNEKIANARDVMLIKQKTERSDLETYYDAQFRTLMEKSPAGADQNKIITQRKELRAKKKDAVALLLQKHKEARRKHKQEAETSFRKMDEKLSELVQKDETGLAKQFEDKKHIINDWHTTWVNRPMDLAVKEHRKLEAIKEREEREARTPWKRTRGFFIFVSNLLEKIQPDRAVPVETIYGHTGKRG